MRTKALLGLAVLAAGIATSVAQSNVYSLNIVGYVNITQPAGTFRLVANPLNTTNNDVANIFPNAASFNYLSIYKFNGVGYDIATFDPDAGGWTQPLTVNPGEGFWLQTPGGPDYANTFVGEVVTKSTNAIPAGFSMKGSAYPASLPIKDGLGIPLTDYDAVYFYNGVGYDIFSIDPDAGTADGWTPSQPSPAVAQGFWVQSGAIKSWVQNFNP